MVHHQRALPRGACHVHGMLTRACVSGAVLVCALTACRGVLGIEALDVASADAGVDASPDSPIAAGEAGATEGGSSGVDAGHCASLDAKGCATCCRTAPFDYGALLR